MGKVKEKLNDELLQVLSWLKEFGIAIQQESIFSEEMEKMGISTPLAELAEKSLKDPIYVSMTGILFAENTIISLLNKNVLAFFNTISDNIDACYQTFENHLHYCIILKDSSILKKAVYFDFLDKYNKNDYHSRFPITFQFIPKDLENTLKVYQKIELESCKNI